jgi:hypothetical protein
VLIVFVGVEVRGTSRRGRCWRFGQRNCFKVLVKMITASPIARCPSFKLLTMQMRLPHLRGIADRSIRDHHVRRQAAQPLTILPPVAALAVGPPAQRVIAQRFSALAPLKHADERQECLLLGVDRKGPADGQGDAVDPERSSLVQG